MISIVVLYFYIIVDIMLYAKLQPCCVIKNARLYGLAAMQSSGTLEKWDFFKSQMTNGLKSSHFSLPFLSYSSVLFLADRRLMTLIWPNQNTAKAMRRRKCILVWIAGRRLSYSDPIDCRSGVLVYALGKRRASLRSRRKSSAQTENISTGVILLSLSY